MLAVKNMHSFFLWKQTFDPFANAVCCIDSICKVLLSLKLSCAVFHVLHFRIWSNVQKLTRNWQAS